MILSMWAHSFRRILTLNFCLPEVVETMPWNKIRSTVARRDESWHAAQ